MHRACVSAAPPAHVVGPRFPQQQGCRLPVAPERMRLSCSRRALGAHPAELMTKRDRPVSQRRGTLGLRLPPEKRGRRNGTDPWPTYGIRSANCPRAWHGDGWSGGIAGRGIGRGYLARNRVVVGLCIRRHARIAVSLSGPDEAAQCVSLGAPGAGADVPDFDLAPIIVGTDVDDRIVDI